MRVIQSVSEVDEDGSLSSGLEEHEDGPWRYSVAAVWHVGSKQD